ADRVVAGATEADACRVAEARSLFPALEVGDHGHRRSNETKAVPLVRLRQRAQRLDSGRIVVRLPGDVSTEGPEAGRPPAVLDAGTRLGGLLPVAAVSANDVRSDELVALELVRAHDSVARVEGIVVAEPARLDSVEVGDVLHEDATVARPIVSMCRESVADFEGEREVVTGGDHQAVAEPVRARSGEP